jgi:hypothetical protein
MPAGRPANTPIRPGSSATFAEALLRGQPDKLAVAKTLIRDQVDELRS